MTVRTLIIYKLHNVFRICNQLQKALLFEVGLKVGDKQMVGIKEYGLLVPTSNRLESVRNLAKIKI